jgi:glutathione reductase (NADPH)
MWELIGGRDTGETTGATKILVDKSTDRIIGAHLLGHDYAELANTIALAMTNGLTTRQIKSATAAYPSTGSDLGSIQRARWRCSGA